MSRVAIKTKYLRPTNHRGSRIKATAMDTYSNGMPLTITKPFGEVFAVTADVEEAHREVARELIQPLYNPNNYADVQIELVAGATQDGYVFVAVNKRIAGSPDPTN
jgi:selenophosphate synthase